MFPGPRFPIRRIVHLSDLHFGNEFEYLLDPLLRQVKLLAPDLIVISGDFVEHANVTEYEQARAYLERLPRPQLVVPGNHDLPFYDPLRRYREGLRYYRKYIGNQRETVFKDDEIVVIGIETPRVFPMKGGRINAQQVETVRTETCGPPPEVVKVLVTHHPLDLPEQFRFRRLAGRARKAVEAMSPCVDLLLAGHLHLSSTGGTAARYRNTGHSAVFAQAGTAISRRNKGEPNSFNSIRVSKERIEIQRYAWEEANGAFAACASERYQHNENGWFKLIAPAESEQVQL